LIASGGVTGDAGSDPEGAVHGLEPAQVLGPVAHALVAVRIRAVAAVRQRIVLELEAVAGGCVLESDAPTGRRDGDRQ
jgi:hypothetical protein